MNAPSGTATNDDYSWKTQNGQGNYLKISPFNTQVGVYFNGDATSYVGTFQQVSSNSFKFVVVKGGINLEMVNATATVAPPPVTLDAGNNLVVNLENAQA